MPIAGVAALSLLMPILKPIASKLIDGVEDLFGSKTGPIKFDAVFKMTRSIIEKLIDTGKLPEEAKNDDAIRLLIESIVQGKITTGDLGPVRDGAWTIENGQGTILLPPGTTLTITVPSK